METNQLAIEGTITQAPQLRRGSIWSRVRRHRTAQFYRLSTFISLLVCYAAYYLCRQNISAAYVPLHQSIGLDPLAFGWITSIGTAVYAFGKVTTGAVADSRWGGKTLFYIGLVGSAVFCALFGLGSTVGFFIVAWSLNRFFQSMGWGGLVTVVTKWFPRSSYGTAMGFMSISYQIGGVAAALFAGLLLSFGVGWQGLFLIPALVLLLIGGFCYPWLIGSPRDRGFELPDQKIDQQKVHEPKQLIDGRRYKMLLKNRSFLLMLTLSFCLTLLRECFNLWVPIYFAQRGASASAAAFKSALFPLLGCLGTMAAGWYSDRFLKARRAPVMCTLLGGLLMVLWLLSRQDKILLLSSPMASMVLMSLSGFFLLGPYSLVSGVVALDFGGVETAGTAAGLLDGAGYLGATLSGIGIGALVVYGGWSLAFMTMMGLSFASLLICLVLWLRRA